MGYASNRMRNYDLSAHCLPVAHLLIRSCYSVVFHLYPTSGLLHLARSPFLGRLEACGQLSYQALRIRTLATIRGTDQFPAYFQPGNAWARLSSDRQTVY